MNCENAQPLFIEYIEGSLDQKVANNLQSHTRNCNACQTELQLLKKTITQVTHNEIPQPDKSFFARFPDQVLSAYNDQSKKQSDTPHPVEPGIFTHLLKSIQERWGQTHWPTLAMPAMVFILALGGTYFVMNETSESAFNSSALYVKSQNTSALIDYLAAQESENVANQFGFSERPFTAVSYNSGRLYSESLTFLAAGQFDKSAKRLMAIQVELEQKRNMDLTKKIQGLLVNINNKDISQNDKIIALAGLRNNIESTLLQQGQKYLTLFRTGTWLAEIRLMAATNLPEHRYSDQARYILDGLENISSPKSVTKKIKKLQPLLSRKDLREADRIKITTLAHQINQLLR